MKTYIIEGGIGKQIMFTAMIAELAKNTEEKQINIITPYTDVFLNNKNVKFVWNVDEQSTNPDIAKITSELIFYEPYKSNFQIRTDGHLLEYWSKGLGIDYKKIDKKPIVTVDNEEITATVNNIADEIGDFIVVQFTGGQSPVGFDPEKTQYQIGMMHEQRNYPYSFANTLINEIKEKYPNLTIIDYSLPNETPGYPHAVRVQLPYIGYVELLKKSKAHIGIDSSLLHMGAAAGVKGIGLYGGIPSWQFGWPSITEITNFKGEIKTFNPTNPWYISIEPTRILKELDKKLSNKK